MSKLIDLTGKSFGRLTVEGLAQRPEYTSKMGAWWLCRCSCGGETVVYGVRLRKGMTRSCGCLRREHAASLKRKKVEGC